MSVQCGVENISILPTLLAEYATTRFFMFGPNETKPQQDSPSTVRPEQINAVAMFEALLEPLRRSRDNFLIQPSEEIMRDLARRVFEELSNLLRMQPGVHDAAVAVETNRLLDHLRGRDVDTRELGSRLEAGSSQPITSSLAVFMFETVLRSLDNPPSGQPSSSALLQVARAVIDSMNNLSQLYPAASNLTVAAETARLLEHLNQRNIDTRELVNQSPADLSELTSPSEIGRPWDLPNQR